MEEVVKGWVYWKLCSTRPYHLFLSNDFFINKTFSKMIKNKIFLPFLLSLPLTLLSLHLRLHSLTLSQTLFLPLSFFSSPSFSFKLQKIPTVNISNQGRRKCCCLIAGNFMGKCEFQVYLYLMKNSLWIILGT